MITLILTTMNKSSLIRIFVFMAIALVLFELVAGTEGKWAIQEHPLIWLILGVLFLCAYLLEASVKTLEKVLYNTLDEKSQERYNEAEALRKEQQFAGVKKTYAKLLDSRAVEEEGEIELDHNYDGIRELDNNLPPWWVYLFYATILFGVVYLGKYHIFDAAPSQAEEYVLQVEQAELEIAAYKRTAKDLIDASTVTFLADASDLNAGKAIFTESCVACHKADGGGGIGPNLTDEYWILGGGISNIFNTISEGGRDGKGMIAWKNDLKPSEMAQVASYVVTLQGTAPEGAKPAEGDLWEDPNATKEETPATEEVAVDSTLITMNN